MAVPPLPNEMYAYILNFIDDDVELLNICNGNPKLCNDNFILNRLRNKYGITKEEADKYSVTPGSFWRSPVKISYLEYYTNLVKRIQAAEKNYFSLMEYAIDSGRTDLAKIAIKLDPYVVDHENIKRVMRSRDPTYAILILFLDYQKNNRKTLHLFINELLMDAIQYHAVGAVKILLDYGASASMMGNTPIRIAVASGNIPMTKVLLDKGASVRDARNSLASASWLNSKVQAELRELFQHFPSEGNK